MIKVVVDKISPSPSGLVCGLIVHYGQEGPIRFAQAVIPWTAFDKDDRAEVLKRFDRLVGDALAAEPDDALPLDWA